MPRGARDRVPCTAVHPMDCFDLQRHSPLPTRGSPFELEQQVIVSDVKSLALFRVSELKAAASVLLSSTVTEGTRS